MHALLDNIIWVRRGQWQRCEWKRECRQSITGWTWMRAVPLSRYVFGRMRNHQEYVIRLLRSLYGFVSINFIYLVIWSLLLPKIPSNIQYCRFRSYLTCTYLPGGRTMPRRNVDGGTTSSNLHMKWYPSVGLGGIHSPPCPCRWLLTEMFFYFNMYNKQGALFEMLVSTIMMFLFGQYNIQRTQPDMYIENIKSFANIFGHFPKFCIH